VTPSRVRRCVVVAVGLFAVPSMQAQNAPRGEPAGFDISTNGAWRVKAGRVAATRSQLLGQRDFAALNAPAAAPAGAVATVVTGTLRVPAVMFRYQNSPMGQYARPASEYDATLFSVVPPNGKPYTLRSFYEQLSNGLFSLQGQSFGWVALNSTEDAYTGGTSCLGQNPYGLSSCNGIWSSAAIVAMQAGLREALTHADSTIDFGQFDNDGSDGIPNSGDDDGVVDAVLFLHASMDGACTFVPNNTHLWSHRFQLAATSPYTTNDNRTGGGKIIANDYILQSGLGTPMGGICDSTAIMPIGTAAHEAGHLLALPDLYDVSNQTQGIGSWGLMGAGNSTMPESPSRFEAWTLQQVGWTTVVPLTGPGTYSIGPSPTADTVLVVDFTPPNARPEHFLIENRQAVESDSALIRIQGGGGLLIWHIDDLKACLINVCGNNVNAGLIHGVALKEADGRRQLWCEDGCNRGDAGDPYPGTSGNTALSFTSDPAATRNADTSFTGFTIDAIQQLVPGGAMSFQLRFGAVTTVRASDTTATVLVDAAGYNVFRDVFHDGSTHTIAVDTPQVSPSGRSRFGFQAWSDGGAIVHQVTGTLAETTFTALLDIVHRLDVSVDGPGTVSFNPPEDSSGTFVPQGTAVTITATPTPPFVFHGWTGDTTAANVSLVVSMARPYAVSANFAPQLVLTSSDPRPGGTMGKAYADTLQASGGGSSRSWSVVAGQLPPGLTLLTSGAITGIPTTTGSFTYTARVTSGAQQAQQQFGITVTAPTLVTANVVNQLLNAAGTLTIDEIRYLDLLGNKNCVVVTQDCFDVGDFLAWVLATGATPGPAPGAATARSGGRP